MHNAMESVQLAGARFMGFAKTDHASLDGGYGPTMKDYDWNYNLTEPPIEPGVIIPRYTVCVAYPINSGASISACRIMRIGLRLRLWTHWSASQLSQPVIPNTS